MNNRLLREFDDKIFDIPELRNCTDIFRDREHAGLILSEMLRSYGGTDAVIFGIPAGGVPVAAPIARKLKLELDVAVVSKVTLPWNTESGYGAVAFDGTVELNEDLISQMGLTQENIQKDIIKVSNKVKRRLEYFRGKKPFPDLKNRTAILVDDGIASGFTMLVAVEALKNKGARDLIIATPTAHLQSIEKIAIHVDLVYCANIRGGWGFAVADAYTNWYDVEEDEVAHILRNYNK